MLRPGRTVLEGGKGGRWAPKSDSSALLGSSPPIFPSSLLSHILLSRSFSLHIPHPMTSSYQPLATLAVADSTFHCYVSTSRSLSSIAQLHSELKRKHPEAAHIPYAASIEDYNDVGRGSEDQTFDDGEPAPAMVGKELLRVLNLYKRSLRREKTMKAHGNSIKDTNRSSGLVSEGSFDGNFERRDSGRNEDGPPVATAVVVVRYFGKRLLGVTCGRLTALYGRVARLALHRHLHGTKVPYVEKYSFGNSHWRNVYGLGAGDAELILDVVPLIEYEDGEKCKENNSSFVKKLLSELKFEGMVGSNDEELPRLQNLQADLPLVEGSKVIPIYRYPGNYSGTEWPTHPWSPTTLYIKRCAEMALQPIYQQHMNHAVTNFYRHSDDCIDHHSDKDLDLNRDGVIISVSLGSVRVMELRDRRFPHDISRIELPPGSMFVLGPYTNSIFTHSILPVLDVDEEKTERSHLSYFSGSGHYGEQIKSIIDGGGRISLTFRDARSFLDVKSQRLFGQGLASSFETPILVEDGMITNKSLSKAVRRVRDEDTKERRSSKLVGAAIGAIIGCASYHGSLCAERENSNATLAYILSKVVASATATCWYLNFLKSANRRLLEERDARAFFSKKSASGNTY